MGLLGAKFGLENKKKKTLGERAEAFGNPYKNAMEGIFAGVDEGAMSDADRADWSAKKQTLLSDLNTALGSRFKSANYVLGQAREAVDEATVGAGKTRAEAAKYGLNFDNIGYDHLPDVEAERQKINQRTADAYEKRRKTLLSRAV
jgi:hypothetical protein